MKSSSAREEKKLRMDIGALLLGIAVFLLGLALIGANVRRYELRQENAELERELSQVRETTAALERERYDAFSRRCRELGLTVPDPERTVILHIRRGSGENTVP